MSQPVSKSTLSEGQCRLVELLQRLNFGRIENLCVRGGEPVFDPAPRVIQKLKMGGENAARPEANLDDFLLRRSVIEMLEAISKIGDGEVLFIEARYGLPCIVEIEKNPSVSGE